MVNSLTDIDVLCDKSIPLHINYTIFDSHHTKQKRKSGNACNRFRSRKPPKNPREVVHKSHQRKISSINLKELQVINSKYQEVVKGNGIPKPNQEHVSSTELTELKKSFSKLVVRNPNSNIDRMPKLLSKSNFVLNTRQSGSNFSLVVNLSKGRLRCPYRLKQKTLKEFRNELSQNSIARGKSKQRYLIIPLISPKELKENKQQVYPFIMENWKSDPLHSSKTQEGSCSCPPDHDKKKDSLRLSESLQVQEEIDKILDHSQCFGDGYPDMYRQVLGPTPDETILAGLQTVIDMCSTTEQNPIRKPLNQTSSNQNIIEWVEKEYSTLEQDCKSNLCHASLCNIKQRKETLHEIEKLVKKKSELDREALTIKQKKTESSTSKTSSTGSFISGATTNEEEAEEEEGEEEEEEEEEEEQEEKKSLSKFSCSCETVQSVDTSRRSSSLGKKCQCTQTYAVQKSKSTQHPSSTSITESTSIKSTAQSDSDDSSSKSTQTSGSEETTSEDRTKSSRTTETDIFHKPLESSETSDEFGKNTHDSESIQCCNKSVQVCKSVPLSTKSVQTCTPSNQLRAGAESIKQIPATLTCANLIKPKRVSLDERSTELSAESLKSTPPSAKSLQISLKDGPVKCQCKRLQASNQLAMVCTKSIENSMRSPSSSTTTPKSTQTSIDKSKSTSSRSVQTSEITSGSSKLSSSVHENCSCECQLSEIKESSLLTKDLSDAVRNQHASVEEPKEEKELSVGKEELRCLECPSSPKTPSPSSCMQSLQLQEQRSSNILSDQEPNNEKAFNSNSKNMLNGCDEKLVGRVANCCENCQKISSSKQLPKSPRRSLTLEPVPEESSSKSSLRKICHTKSCELSVKFQTNVPEGTCPRPKLSHFPCGNVPHRRKHRCIRSERSKERQIEKTFSLKNELSKESQTVGDCLTKTASSEVRYAMVRITKFEQYSTFEILSSSIRKPKCVPATTETIFVVKNKTK